MKIIYPPEYLKIINPIIFLAGPIQGAPNWHEKAIDFISKEVDGAIACPKRLIKIEGEFTKKMYNEQVDWETYHLNKAALNGVILFWLAKEKFHQCDRAYAQTTRFELAEWKEKRKPLIKKINLVVGIEKGFSGERYIKRRLSQECYNLVIHSTLKQTCLEAIKIYEKIKC